jgi:hypothetical protein
MKLDHPFLRQPPPEFRGAGSLAAEQSDIRIITSGKNDHPVTGLPIPVRRNRFLSIFQVPCRVICVAPKTRGSPLRRTFGDLLTGLFGEVHGRRECFFKLRHELVDAKRLEEYGRAAGLTSFHD